MLPPNSQTPTPIPPPDLPRHCLQEAGGCGLAFDRLAQAVLPAGDDWAPLREGAIAAMQRNAATKVRRCCSSPLLCQRNRYAHACRRDS